MELETHTLKRSLNAIRKKAVFMNVAAVRSFLDAGDIVNPELAGPSPYHNVVCMVVYVCRSTGNFYCQYEEKIKALDEKYNGVEVFIPNCAPYLANVVYMVQYLQRLNPEAELLFGVDNVPCYEWANRMHFCLFVIAEKQEDLVRLDSILKTAEQEAAVL